MIASRLPFAAEFLARLGPRPRSDGAAVPSRSAPYRLLDAFGHALRPQWPHRLNDHLRRDVGLEPLPKQKEVFWPW